MTAWRGAAALAVAGSLLLASASRAGAVDDVRVERDEVRGEVSGDRIVGVTRFRGDHLALTDTGVIVRKRRSEPWRAVGTATGIDATAVRGIAAAAGTLVAVGYSSTPVPGRASQYSPLAWRSTDGTAWVPADTSAVARVGGVDVRAVLNGVITDGTGFVAFGWRDRVDEDGVLAAGLWRSEDGTTWAPLEASGLDDAGEYGNQEVDGLARGASEGIAVQSTECLDCDDDATLGLWRGTIGGDWKELRFDGLDAFDQPNTDVFPAIVTVGDQYVLLATRGRTDPKLGTWSTDDGRHWTATGGPEDPNGSVDAAASDRRGAVALTLRRGTLHAWTIAAAG